MYVKRLSHGLCFYLERWLNLLAYRYFIVVNSCASNPLTLLHQLILPFQNGDLFFSTQPEILHNQLSELLELMIEVLPSCQFSAKRHRLDCLHFLIVSVLKVINTWYLMILIQDLRNQLVIVNFGSQHHNSGHVLFIGQY